MKLASTSCWPLALVLGISIGAIALWLGLGPLNPVAGPVTSTGRTLGEIEPRIPISLTTTPGDADSTFRITNSGSYYLTSNFTGEAAKKGIEIQVGSGAQVTIDLNGFRMVGTGATSTQPAIYIDGSNAKVVVRNGAISSWRQAIQHFIGGSILVEDVHAYQSTLIQFDLVNATCVRCYADDGSNAGFFISGGILIDCTARSNSGNGFSIGTTATTLRGCVAIGNGGSGMDAGGGVVESCRSESNTLNGFVNASSITGSVASSNGGDGISSAFISVIRGCTVVASSGDGIQVSSGSRVEGNTISTSGLNGIHVLGSRNSIVGNTVSSPGRTTGVFAGVRCAGDDNTIDSNHITNLLVGGDDFGIQVTGSRNLIVRNQLSAISTYLNIGAGNTSGGASGTPSTAGPWTNITY